MSYFQQGDRLTNQRLLRVWITLGDEDQYNRVKPILARLADRGWDRWAGAAKHAHWDVMEVAITRHGY